MYRVNGYKRRLSSGDSLSPKRQKITLYLDDNRPVRTIEVTGIEDEVTSGYLRGYFDHAVGRVSSVSFINKLQGKKLIRTALVSFVLPEDAASVISDPDLSSKFKFIIKQAEKIYQPKLDPSALNFEQLNDHCLLHIASYLSMADVINLSKSSTRLQSFAQLIFQKKTHFTFGTNTGDSSIDGENVESLLQEVGPYIRSVKGKLLDKTKLDWLTRNCSNVTELELEKPYHILTSSVASQFFVNLETLILSESPIFDAGLKSITSISHLQSLQLDSCWNVIGNFFSRWRHCRLQSLKISNCNQIRPEVVDSFVANNRLVKFAYDNGRFFEHFRRLPAKCTDQFEELELNVSDVTPRTELDNVDFRNLRRLTHLAVTVPAVGNYNGILVAMIQIPALRSLTVRRMTLNAGTLPCLGRLKNLRKLCLLQVNNQIGVELYSTLHQHLPQLTDLSIANYVVAPQHIFVNIQGRYSYVPNPEGIQPKWICKLISSLPALQYLSHDMMTNDILNAIRATQRIFNRRPIEVEAPSYGFSAAEVKRFNAASRGYVKFKAACLLDDEYTRRHRNQKNYSYF